MECQSTLAEGIAIPAPIRGRQIVEAVKKTKGDIIMVSEGEIKQALKETCRKGFYIEPTSAAAVAGIKKFLETNKINKNARIVSAFTGHGLKAGEKMLSAF
ncbi:MAG: pyridoxal-phosphate dependent enzyme, partial [bacterium]|nr:pyridoxal-phosphate dependent enzyme [bacterium]